MAILVSLSVLKEMFDLTDEALMGSFRFDTLEKTGVSLRTLELFRARVLKSEAVGETFDEVTKGIIDSLGLETGQQRHDSPHFHSNMANLTRLGLFTRTLEHFLGALSQLFPERCEALPEEIRKRYGERIGRFADAKSSEGRRRLETAAADLWFLVGRFREEAAVAALPEFALLERLLSEQCRIEGEAAILKEGKEIASDSLQSPFDPEASYDGHKGVGYQAQLSETCGADNPVQVITRIEVEPAHKSDQHALIPALDDLVEREIAPEKMFADTAYNSGDNLLAAAQQGVDLVAPTPGKGDPDGIVLGAFRVGPEASIGWWPVPKGRRPCGVGSARTDEPAICSSIRRVVRLVLWRRIARRDGRADDFGSIPATSPRPSAGRGRRANRSRRRMPSAPGSNRSTRNSRRPTGWGKSGRGVCCGSHLRRQ
ncbi:hypothetical protein SIID45300_00341 [Candidatus Magnetaquicoccaceae bacterium FCR-1]|uniref:Transposase n=1 Tax=Candidatus Magnetaquiglobus chichijimensis TaxID=3141448 RepID=A0ABQ0C5A1_9PROT